MRTTPARSLLTRLLGLTLLLGATAGGLGGCASTKDLATSLRYADNRPVGVENIRFSDLNSMKRGKACTVNFFYFIPIWGDGSILTAADDGGIGTVKLIGETGRWYFPFSTNCTVVFGDNVTPPAATPAATPPAVAASK
ncbi:MAG: TRL domain-containing protein [Leptothrix ochracea]|uniref:TRL domain-containing protein n=1 Tax=Leptothrix ochracea TaxID=735331 RepID=UPI0034E22116